MRGALASTPPCLPANTRRGPFAARSPQAVGFHYAKTLLHLVEQKASLGGPLLGGQRHGCVRGCRRHHAQAVLVRRRVPCTCALQLGLETDPADVLNELIRCCRKGGTVSVVGVYAGARQAATQAAPRHCQGGKDAAEALHSCATLCRVHQPLQHRRVHGEGPDGQWRVQSVRTTWGGVGRCCSVTPAAPGMHAHARHADARGADAGAAVLARAAAQGAQSLLRSWAVLGARHTQEEACGAHAAERKAQGPKVHLGPTGTLLPALQVLSGALKPSLVITHTLPLEAADRAFKLFNEKADGCIKVSLSGPAHLRSPVLPALRPA